MKSPAKSLLEPRSAFTLLELIFVVLLIGILIGMLLPAVRRVREPARRTDCSNKLRQLALASFNFESAHSHFPAPMGDPMLLEIAESDDVGRIGGLVLLLPFIEQSRLWEQAGEPMTINEHSFPAMPPPTDQNYPVWQNHIEGFRCASSIGSEMLFGETNYAFCIGDMAIDIHKPKHERGAFACGKNLTEGHFSDGTSNTIMMAEIGTSVRPALLAQVAINQSSEILNNPQLCLDLVSPDNSKLLNKSIALKKPGRGGNWADGSATYSLFNTILPPNSPSASIGDEMADGIYSAGGMHPGGINVARADGSVQFLSENIDAGDPTSPTIKPEQLDAGPTASPYGVWGALGTANGEDDAEEY